MNKYLTRAITNPAYNKVRDAIKEILQWAPGSVGGLMEEVAGRLEESVKHLLTPGMIFEALGFRYVGPVDGHDLDALVGTFSRVREMNGPILVHLLSQKGKGFHLAEEDPWTWHAASPFDKISGTVAKRKAGLPRYQKVFGRGLTDLASENDKIVAITAAMPDGTRHQYLLGHPPGPLLRRRHRRGAWRDLRGRAGHRGRAPGRGHLLDVPATWPSTRLYTTWPFKTFRSCSASIEPVWPAKTVRPTTEPSTWRTCLPCRA